MSKWAKKFRVREGDDRQEYTDDGHAVRKTHDTDGRPSVAAVHFCLRAAGNCDDVAVGKAYPAAAVFVWR
jgi:hypothetical protein